MAYIPRIWKTIDWYTLSLILILGFIGLVFIWSATYKEDATFSVYFIKQAFGLFSGIFIYIICSSFDYRNLMRWGYLLYFATIALLIFTIIKGSIGMGAQRWINVGFFKFQPSELTKLFFPAYLTYYLYIHNPSFIYSLRDFIPVMTTLAISWLLIAKQPDLGTALIILFSASIMLWFAGINRKFFICCFILITVGAPLGWYFLKPYQRQRIEVFLGQGSAHKERYQIEQSKIAIGSGGIYGKGLLLGTQNKFQFLPESRTDCIFAVICEETGLLGALTILFLYALLFSRLIIIIQRLDSPFSQLFGFGLIMHIIFSTIINIGMVLGMLPVVGIPLPLISYGISNLWITCASLGFLQSIINGRSYLRL